MPIFTSCCSCIRSGIIGMLLSLPSAASVFAEVPSEPHMILQKLAQVEYKQLNSKDKVSLNVPSTWTTREGSRSGIIFTDPNFLAVVGGAYRVDKALTAADLKGALEQLFFTTFESSDPMQKALIGGREITVIQLEGRVSGERTQVLAGVSTVGENKSVIYFASAPEHWFESYRAVFEDIMLSLTASP